MGRHTGAVRYATNTPPTWTGLVNMYIYGGSALSLLTLVFGLATTGIINGAIQVLLDFYITKLVPWPFGASVGGKMV